MLRTICTGAALLALVSLTVPAAAEENGPDWLSAVGDFVEAGLGPARTMEDIRREEERARQEVLRDAATREVPVADEAEMEVKVRPDEDGDSEADTAEADTAPPSAEANADTTAEAAPAVAAPAPAPVPTPLPVVAPAAASARGAPNAPEMPASKGGHVAALPVPPARPVVPVSARISVPAPPLPPEPLFSRIAATATVDQAIRLGGSEDTYERRLVVPTSD